MGSTPDLTGNEYIGKTFRWRMVYDLRPTPQLHLIWYKNAILLNVNAGYLFDNQGKLQTADNNTVEIRSDYYNTYYYASPGSEYNLGID
jgi:hypothetical protein